MVKLQVFCFKFELVWCTIPAFQRVLFDFPGQEGLTVLFSRNQKCTKICSTISHATVRDEIVETTALLEGFLSLGSEMDMWTAENFLYTNECDSGSFLS